VSNVICGSVSRPLRLDRGWPLLSIDVADALLDERRELTERVRN
jgi:hypothetical protein